MIEKEQITEPVATESENEEPVIKRTIDVCYDEAMRDKDIKKITVFKNTLRNKPCPCGSKKKFKKCCMNKVAHNSFVLRKPVTEENIAT